MKIFYKKDFQRVTVELNKTIIELNRANFKLDKYRENTKQLELLRTQNLEEIKSLKTAKGGYTKEINKLKAIIYEKDELIDSKQSLIDERDKEIVNLNKEILDLKSDRYLIKKIPSGKTPNTVKTKLSKPMSATVRKFMKENFDE